jgi:hypothetical protein
MPAMRIAAMITLDKASLFLDSAVGSSGCSGTVATCDRVERLFCPSGIPLRLSGRISDETLGERDSWRETGRERAPFAEGGLESVNGEGLVSKDRDLRWAKDDCDSFPRATAAALPSGLLVCNGRLFEDITLSFRRIGGGVRREELSFADGSRIVINRCW